MNKTSHYTLYLTVYVMIPISYCVLINCNDNCIQEFRNLQRFKNIIINLPKCSTRRYDLIIEKCEKGCNCRYKHFTNIHRFR